MTAITYVSHPTNELKVKIGWGKGEAWWQAKDLLAEMIQAICLKLAEEGSGCPGVIYNKVIKDLGYNEEAIIWHRDQHEAEAEEVYKKACEEWKAILRQIANAFIDDDEDDQPTQQQVDGRLLFIQHFEHLWD